jgi:hypothetical protein
MRDERRGNTVRLTDNWRLKPQLYNQSPPVLKRCSTCLVGSPAQLHFSLRGLNIRVNDRLNRTVLRGEGRGEKLVIIVNTGFSLIPHPSSLTPHP